jgi:hypothetical protein
MATPRRGFSDQTWGSCNRFLAGQVGRRARISSGRRAGQADVDESTRGEWRKPGHVAQLSRGGGLRRGRSRRRSGRRKTRRGRMPHLILGFRGVEIVRRNGAREFPSVRSAASCVTSRRARAYPPFCVSDESGAGVPCPSGGGGVTGGLGVGAAWVPSAVAGGAVGGPVEAAAVQDAGEWGAGAGGGAGLMREPSLRWGGVHGRVATPLSIYHSPGASAARARPQVLGSLRRIR